MSKVRKIQSFLKTNRSLFGATFVLVIIFLLNAVFPEKITKVVTSEDCNGKNCQILDNASLSDERKALFINDIVQTKPGEYYRLSFWENATKDTNLVVKTSNAVDEERIIDELKLEKTGREKVHEITFRSATSSTDIVFEKKNDKDGADISISRVYISKLDLQNDQDLLVLKPTIRGDINMDNLDQWQKDNSYSFNQLKDSDIILGQIFKPEADYITGVTLDMDIITQDNNGGKKYKFELREAEFDGEVPEITSEVLSNIDFTPRSIEKYRQEDGKFKFPIFAKLDPEKFYFAGINNDRVSVDEFNYLRLKGTRDKDKYNKGTAAVKTKGKTYFTVGSLYFKTHQSKYTEYQGKVVLSGEVIEDIGKSKGLFTYRPPGNIYDLADLWKYSPDIRFDENKKVLAGKIRPGKDSYMLYKFDTIFPANKITVIGRQADLGWSRISVLYSHDGIDWTEVPDIINDSQLSQDKFQYFEHSWHPNPAKNELYVKIIPKEFAGKAKYGLSNFEVKADILIR